MTRLITGAIKKDATVVAITTKGQRHVRYASLES
jgi:hypothetical protein